MTNQEFNRLTRQAWTQYPSITEEVMLELQETYIEAAKLAQAEVLRAEREGLSVLTSSSKDAINQQLDRGVGLIEDATKKSISQGIESVLGVEDNITNAWILDATKEAGLNKNIITLSGLENMNVVVREKVLQLTISRQFQDNYLLSERIWKSASLYKTDMARVINLGLAQGKDNIVIAKALGEYITDGAESLTRARTYGKIKYGNKGLYSRISRNVDYRALRLVRSEEYMSLQSAAILRAQDNPGATGQFNWVKNSFTAHDCVCADNQAGSPYTKETIPGYPHPNCLCTIEPVLMNQQEFVDDLVKWSKGESVPYIDDWYNTQYLLTK
jgi:hypothetical protein